MQGASSLRYRRDRKVRQGAAGAEVPSPLPPPPDSPPGSAPGGRNLPPIQGMGDGAAKKLLDVPPLSLEKASQAAKAAVSRWELVRDAVIGGEAV